MTAEILYQHLCECGVTLALSAEGMGLDVDAPRGLLTPELVAWIREHKAGLVEIVYDREERTAIEAEGCAREKELKRWAREHRAVRLLAAKLGGLEVLDVRRVA